MAKKPAGAARPPARSATTPSLAGYAVLQQQTVGMKNPTAAAPGGLRPEDAGDGLTVAGRDIRDVLAAGEAASRQQRQVATKPPEAVSTIVASVDGAKRAGFKPQFMQPPTQPPTLGKPVTGAEKQTYSKTGREHSAAQIAAYQNRSKRS
jgi:hypothetical protein